MGNKYTAEHLAMVADDPVPLSQRLRGDYGNRSFDTPPIQHVAADALDAKDAEIVRLKAEKQERDDRIAFQDATLMDRSITIRDLEEAGRGASEAIDGAVDRIKLAYRGELKTPLKDAVAPLIDARESLVTVLCVPQPKESPC